MPSLNVPAATDQAESTRLRLVFFALLLVSLFVLLFARMWYLQVMAGADFADRAEGNAVRTVSMEAPRGKILDREGEPLVDNEFVYVVGVQPAEIDDDEEEDVYEDLGEVLDMDGDEIATEIERSRVSPLRPRPIAVDVPEEVVLYIWENQSTRYPGVYAERLPRRTYPQGDLASHVLGYVTEIGEDQLASEAYEDYRAGELIGSAGVESGYESELRGTEGLRRLEVNPRNEVVRQLDEVLPTPGSDLRLTLDSDVQADTEEALLEGIETARQEPDDNNVASTLRATGGAVVVLDADNGEVRAMASYPDYDPSEFVGGVSTEYFADIQDPDNEIPLLNRAIQQTYPPGSVFKVVTASAALEHGFVGPNETLPCPPQWEWNDQTFPNWSSVDSGDISMAQSLTESCNTVYYELARDMWHAEQASGDDEREYLADHAEEWGLGGTLGIDLASERGGVVPGREWKREYWEQTRDRNCALAETAPDGSYEERLYTELCSEQGANWRGGDAVNMSIGQGDVQTTPLQIASVYAAVANGGTVFAPRVADEVVRPDGEVEAVEPEVVNDLELSDSTVQVLRSGLQGVNEDGGTAESTFEDFGPTIAGKTGTAQFGDSKQPYSWYAGYTVDPAEDGSRYVVVSLIEEGGGGSQTSAPIVRRVFESVLDVEETEIDLGEVTD
ncbi:penicillin-binding protein 2 [Egibacter rhizosphaerae]|uniref:penicillin-binding protein 2 n=1 Tax=Egibacter rhizosphaerae TaxID=1670831 RepID=UPI0013F17D63|nr:penicillin-binding protein 2 [Egibacter rhizosphaerae]